MNELIAIYLAGATATMILTATSAKRVLKTKRLSREAPTKSLIALLIIIMTATWPAFWGAVILKRMENKRNE